MIVREESPEVEPFPTLAQVSKKTQKTHPLRNSPATPTKRALHKNSTTEESPEANLPPTQTNQPPWNNLDESTQVIEDRSANVSMEDPKEFKQKRGPMKMKSLCMDANGRVEIRFNSKGQPIGAGSVSLSSFLGPLVREIVHVTIVDWRRVTKGMKEVLWKSVQARFKVDKPWQQDYIFKQMGELWRASKSRLVTKLGGAPNNEERLKLKPDNIKSNVEWKAFYWFGSGEVVAKGHWSSSDPKDLVHHVPLGPNAIKVWIHVPIKPDAFLWRPNSEMVYIEDAVGSIVAWPVDKVVMCLKEMSWKDYSVEQLS
ncbi:hypothetical protein TIFTF001_039840 [Ficus carica]|uniref:Transposase Tnp1/En/Spm-like domain-containing protein n=1 Tax=Ficus carica TaxID=3494 RepID=A0AA87Z097_FICCA|nr:hypothetical protein TIFTF001_039840 [Ficus carica]